MSVDRSNQLDLLDGLNIAVSQEEVRRKDRNVERPIIFNDPDPKEIFLGGVRLDNYLRSTGDRSAFVVRRMMEQHDWSKFEKKLSTRRPSGVCAALHVRPDSLWSDARSE